MRSINLNYNVPISNYTEGINDVTNEGVEKNELGDFPSIDFLIEGVAINSVVTDNGHKFEADELRKSVSSLIGRPLLIDHDNRSEMIAGKVIAAEFDEINENIKFKARINDTERGIKMRQLIKLGDLNTVSVGAVVDVNETEFDSDENVEILRGIKFKELSLVAVPADDGAKFRTIRMAFNSALNKSNPNNDIINDTNSTNNNNNTNTLPEEGKDLKTTQNDSTDNTQDGQDEQTTKTSPDTYPTSQSTETLGEIQIKGGQTMEEKSTELHNQVSNLESEVKSIKDSQDAHKELLGDLIKSLGGIEETLEEIKEFGNNRPQADVDEVEPEETKEEPKKDKKDKEDKEDKEDTEDTEEVEEPEESEESDESEEPEEDDEDDDEDEDEDYDEKVGESYKVEKGYKHFTVVRENYR